MLLTLFVGFVCAEQYFDASMDVLAQHGRELKTTYAPFYAGANGYGPREKFSKGAIAGMVIGFTVLGGLLLYAVLMICVDSALRKVQYEQNLKDDFKEMKELGFEEHEIKELRRVFDKIEELGRDAFEQEQAEAMAAMN